ncbi:GIY-YIG nuclease family protein [Gorillibacterium timonense]|uniref:GIY-YIG nuclease family protein n=1 Tax=Gorillibacterium timonense TaxID=1689269 RepID=UPI00071D6ED6|nr:hypothetical protein [Gorillibacterium timonense]
MNSMDEIKAILMNTIILARDAEQYVPGQPGVYCIAISDVNLLTDPFRTELITRNHKILYVGQASNSLLERLVHQDLRHKSPASFFRSIGAVIGYRPVKGFSKNYKFSVEDTMKIINWINVNLFVSWHIVDKELLDVTERALINDLKPIMNIKDNPYKLKELQDLRKQCRQFASQ